MQTETFKSFNTIFTLDQVKDGDWRIIWSNHAPSDRPTFHTIMPPIAIGLTSLACIWWFYRMVQLNHFFFETSTLVLILTCFTYLHAVRNYHTECRYLLHSDGSITNLRSLDPKKLPIQEIRIDQDKSLFRVVVRAGYYNLEIAHFPQRDQADKLRLFLKSLTEIQPSGF